MEDKIGLLVEETGCDPAEAELALQMSGYEAAEALRLLAGRLRHILVLKLKFRDLAGPRYGLALIVANVKTGAVLRSRAVVSFNPVVYAAALGEHWFDFEKRIYACRLWEGSLQPQSLDVESALAEHFGHWPSEALTGPEDGEARLESELRSALGSRPDAPGMELKLKKEILNLGEFNALGNRASAVPSGRRWSHRKSQDQLVLKVAAEEDPVGISAAEVRSGDVVSVLISDSRDIAHYLWKIFGGYAEGAPAALLCPVEAVESSSSKVLLRVRFSAGVCGDASVSPGTSIKVVRVLLKKPVHSWWRRVLTGRTS